MPLNIHLTKAAERFPKVYKAICFGRDAHNSINHNRKYTNLPYWTHTEEVADLVAYVAPDDENAIIAAAFHDLIEDVTPLKPEIYNEKVIRNLYGDDVAKLVVELTDVFTKESYPDKNRAERKFLERERLKTISARGKTIKLADLISNTSSIVEHDPNFARTYLHEKELLLPYLMDGNPTLLVRVGQQLIGAKQKLGMFTPVIVVSQKS